MKRLLVLLPLLGIFVSPAACAGEKATPAGKPATATAAPAPPAKFSDVDFARLQLAQAQMNDADKSYALAQHAVADSQRIYREAQQRMNALLAKYDLRAEDLASHAAAISDDGAITRSAPPAKPPKK